MNGLWTRRRVLQAAACAALVSSHEAWSFDRVSAGHRYRAWLVQLREDLTAVMSQVPSGQEVALDDIHRLCERSIVPHSRAAKNFFEWLNVSRQQGQRRGSGGIASMDFLSIILRLLQASIPAGTGGVFKEPEGSGFPDQRLSVWYMHIHGGEILQRYFTSSAMFKPYHLPAEGMLERNAYPFLTFEEKGDTLCFGSFGREWFGAAETLYETQFH